MKIHVVGKLRLQGTSKKTRNPYNFIQVHYLGRAPGVIGEAALTLNLDSKDYPFENIKIPGDYIADFDGKGFVVDFYPPPPLPANSIDTTVQSAADECGSTATPIAAVVASPSWNRNRNSFASFFMAGKGGPIPYSVALPLERGSNNYYSIIQGDFIMIEASENFLPP